MGRAVGSTLLVDRLRGRDDHLLNGQALVADDLQELGRSEAVDVDILRHLWHVAAVRCLVEDDVEGELRKKGRFMCWWT